MSTNSSRGAADRRHPSPLLRGVVLVVSDCKSTRVDLEAALPRAGYECVGADEGVEALWRARQQEFDAVITDMQLRTMDGLELLSELRQLAGYARVPVFVLISDCSRELLRAGREAGALWVVKPLDIQKLVDSVGEEMARGLPRRLSQRSLAR